MAADALFKTMSLLKQAANEVVAKERRDLVHKRAVMVASEEFMALIYGLRASVPLIELRQESACPSNVAVPWDGFSLVTKSGTTLVTWLTESGQIR
jgi:hypothetical protein